jgi:DNA gyrase subunit A
MDNQLKSQVNIEDEMKRSYLDYAMSVIIGRALPDVRDGLKPVHRRILYSMNEKGLSPSKPYRKSATVVGDVLGGYHPHGDTAVYDSMVRMAQDFSMRYPLIDGQGNWGSVDGDNAAAYRYTEARLMRISTELLADIEKETVKFVPNYNEELQEPTVLPTRVPNLLVNGSDGIAVGMATKIPPHNLGEIIEATIQLLQHPNTKSADLIKMVPGPDFPTGGFIYGREGVKQAYETGRGVMQLRARVAIDRIGRGAQERDAIVITEIPFQVNKAKLIEHIADLVNDKKVEGISEIRDETDRESSAQKKVRIVIELKRDAVPQIILNKLYKMTQMQISFGMINLSIVNGQPKILNLAETLNEFIAFRREVVRNRTNYELKKARSRAHILEGLKKAIDIIDEIIKLIRA